MGGIERALTVLADWFSDNGNDVFFVSCHAENAFYKPCEKVVLIEPPFAYPRNKLLKAFHYLKIVSYIRKQVSKINPDVVLAFGDTFNPLVLFALTGKDYPVFISDRTSPDFHFHPAVKLGKKLFYSRAKGFIAQTERAASAKRREYGDKLRIEVIPNAIRQVQVKDVEKEKIILYSGRLSEEKGPDRLLEAFAEIKNKDGWKLVFAGPGPMEREMVTRTRELKIEEQVRFLGKVTDIDLWYSKAEIFVLPSRLEGFPNSLCEAMAAGLPVICFDSIPFEEILTNDVDGIVVKDGDIAALSEAIENLMLNHKLREKIGSQATLISKRLNRDTIGNKILEFMNI